MDVPLEATLPTPWSIIRAVALDTFQSSTAESPPVTAAGVELNELITGRLGAAVQKHEVNNIGRAKTTNNTV
jgi:hypothetical protein